MEILGVSPLSALSGPRKTGKLTSRTPSAESRVKVNKIASTGLRAKGSATQHPGAGWLPRAGACGVPKEAGNR
jgi:hypothetical protein